MFDFIFRRTIYKKLDKEQQNVAMLQKSRVLTYVVSSIITYFLLTLPITFSIVELIINRHDSEGIVVWGLLVLCCIVYLIIILIEFRKKINEFKEWLTNNMYRFLYVTRGKAISKDDFSIIKKEKKNLYDNMLAIETIGYCYWVSFILLKYLKKGYIQFMSVREVCGTSKHKYTMHVLYINNGWCYDTYSERQQPLNRVMKQLNPRVYKSFSYEDIKDKTYEEFRREQLLALKKWCEENDCYQNFLGI